MTKWITNWPHGGKWGECGAAMAAQIAAEGRYQVRLVSKTFVVSRFILATPRWAQTVLQRHPAVALALRLQSIDRQRFAAAQSPPRARTGSTGPPRPQRIPPRQQRLSIAA